MALLFPLGPGSGQQPDLQGPPQDLLPTEAHAEAVLLQEPTDHHPSGPASVPGGAEDTRQQHQEGVRWDLQWSLQNELHR